MGIDIESLTSVVALVLAGTFMLGVAAGLVGCFLLLRRRSLIADALGHATLPGIAGAAFIGAALGFSSLPWVMMFVAASVTTLLALLAIRLLSQKTRLQNDAAIALTLSLSFALGLLVMSALPMLDSPIVSGLSGLIFGQAAIMRYSDILGILCVTFIAVFVVRRFGKDMALVAFDPVYASSLGLRVGFIDAMLLALAALVTVMALPAVGLILVVALLIIPAATARLWCVRLRPMLIASALIGGFSAMAGVLLSFSLPDMPTGAMIVLCAFACFMLSLLLAPRRGILSSGVDE